MTGEPSLVQFTLERLEEEVDFALTALPVFVDGLPRAVEKRFLDRGAVLADIQLQQQIVAACVEAMQREQGTAPTGPQDGPVTALGIEIIRGIAERFADHPDYDRSWRA